MDFMRGCYFRDTRKIPVTVYRGYYFRVGVIFAMNVQWWKTRKLPPTRKFPSLRYANGSFSLTYHMYIPSEGYGPFRRLDPRLHSGIRTYDLKKAWPLSTLPLQWSVSLKAVNTKVCIQMNRKRQSDVIPLPIIGGARPVTGEEI